MAPTATMNNQPPGPTSGVPTEARVNQLFGSTLEGDLLQGPASDGAGDEVFCSTLQGDISTKEPATAAPSKTAKPYLPRADYKHNDHSALGEGLEPAGTNVRLSQGALSAEDTRLQMIEIEEAEKLIKSMGPLGSEAAICAGADKDGCHYELNINWEGNFTACATQTMKALPLTMMEIVGLIREPDLIPLPRWPGLPRLETVSIVHEFAPNNVVYHVGIEPWGPFPGVDSIAVAVAFVRPDGAIVGFARSPPEGDEKVHRGWNVLPVARRRTRMELAGCAWVVTPRPDGKTDVTIYMKTKIPIPKWLVPPTLVRWVTPKVFRKVLPLLTNEKTKEPFRMRLREDSRGFYAVMRKQLGLDAPTSRDFSPAAMPTTFEACIKAYEWDLARKLAVSDEQKQDLQDSMLRVQTLEAHVNRGEKDKAIALAITDVEIAKIKLYGKKPPTRDIRGAPRGYFDPKRPKPRGAQAC